MSAFIFEFWLEINTNCTMFLHQTIRSLHATAMIRQRTMTCRLLYYSCAYQALYLISLVSTQVYWTCALSSSFSSFFSIGCSWSSLDASELPHIVTSRALSGIAHQVATEYRIGSFVMWDNSVGILEYYAKISL